MKISGGQMLNGRYFRHIYQLINRMWGWLERLVFVEWVQAANQQCFALGIKDWLVRDGCFGHRQ